MLTSELMLFSWFILL